MVSYHYLQRSLFCAETIKSTHPPYRNISNTSVHRNSYSLSTHGLTWMSEADGGGSRLLGGVAHGSGVSQDALRSCERPGDTVPWCGHWQAPGDRRLRWGQGPLTPHILNAVLGANCSQHKDHRAKNINTVITNQKGKVTSWWRSMFSVHIAI